MSWRIFCSCLIVALVFTSARAQTTLSLSLSEDSGDQFCLDLSAMYLGDEEKHLGSQNYRLFYDSQLMQLDPDASISYLPGDDYTFRIVQNRGGVDGSEVGILPFDSHLGFINASVIHNSAPADGFRLGTGKIPVRLIRLCFELNASEPGSVVIARRGLTDGYGRAFTELAAGDKDGTTQSIIIEEYSDFSPR
ncbi:MAG: hypothetical protein AAFQ02_00390 [Bacteroidota bacterium]